MRGKRSAPPLELQLPAVPVHQMLDHLPQPEQELPAQLPSPQQLRQLFRAARRYRDQFVSRLAGKRTPSGFAGMRGRKRSVSGREVQVQREDLMEKRVPSGFGGLRGKKTKRLEEVKKRMPQDSFFGLRGRRG